MYKADFKASYGAGRKYDELQQSQTYYFLSKTGEYQKVNLNKKNLLKVLADKQQQITALLGKEQINTASEEGWIKTLAYYETLK